MVCERAGVGIQQGGKWGGGGVRQTCLISSSRHFSCFSGHRVFVQVELLSVGFFFAGVGGLTQVSRPQDESFKELIFLPSQSNNKWRL